MVFNVRKPFHRSNTAEAISIEDASPSNDGIKTSDDIPPKSDITSTAFKVSGVEIESELTEFKELHQWDPNLPASVQHQVDNALKTHDLEREVELDHELNQENSIYPEVRAAVRNYDEDVPANTIRAWVIGLIFATAGSGINMLFSLRNPSVFISIVVIQTVSYPVGMAMARWLPSKTFTTFGVKWSLNPGPFNIKEHAIIVIMANASWSGGPAYSTDVLLAQQVHYGQNFHWGFQILLTLTCQMLGYGMAGMARRWLVWPAAMIWPTDLVNTVLFYGLHDHSPSDPAKTNGWKVGRYKFFLIVLIGSFVWAWIPTWLGSFLSVFTFACWIAPNNAVVNQVFGGQTGIGLIPLTFDWNYISGFVSSPLPTPWFAIANTTIGLVIFFIIGSAGIHYSGAWYSLWLPMSTTLSYDNTGAEYNVTKILTPEFTLDLDAYHSYSPIFLSTTFALTYGISFATISSLVVHCALFNGKEIWRRARASRAEEPDIHAKLMLKYREAPDWWYLSLFLTIFALGLVSCLAWDTHMPWWAFVVSQIIAAVFLIPVGMIQAVTNIQIGLNVITEFIVGYMLPGRPIAMMMFKMFGYISMAQALAFCQDLKLAHYLKIPPRTIFWAQVVATFWTSIVQIAVMNWALGNIDNVCSPDQTDNYTCPNAEVFYTASVLWGLIGPKRVFGPASPVYHASMWFFLLGALVPAVIYLVARFYPRSGARYLIAPVIFGGTGLIPPATTLNYGSWAIVGYIFNKWIKDRYLGWWSRYNYILSAALDSGLFIALIVIFFSLQLTKQVKPSWWGNNISNTDGDGFAITQAIVAPGDTFGPTVWN